MVHRSAGVKNFWRTRGTIFKMVSLVVFLRGLGKLSSWGWGRGGGSVELYVTD